MNTNIIVFYHGGCTDGFGGAYAAWKKFGDTATYVPLSRGDEPFPDVTGKEVYFVDFVYDKARMDEIAAQAQSLVALDHHIGVQDVTESFPGSVFNNDKSGAGIAWEYFNPGVPLPILLAHVQDDDLFRYELPDTRAIISYLIVNPFSFEFWDTLVTQLENAEHQEAFLTKVRTYAEYFQLLANVAVEHAKLIEFEGHRCYFATAHPLKPMKSLVGNLLAAKQGPFALVVAAHPKGYGVSIRGDGTVNVAEIAAKYGGNGHKNSAGFVIPAEGPLPWTLIEDDETTGN